MREKEGGREGGREEGRETLLGINVHNGGHAWVHMCGRMQYLIRVVNACVRVNRMQSLTVLSGHTRLALHCMCVRAPLSPPPLFTTPAVDTEQAALHCTHGAQRDEVPLLKSTPCSISAGASYGELCEEVRESCTRMVDSLVIRRG